MYTVSEAVASITEAFSIVLVNGWNLIPLSKDSLFDLSFYGKFLVSDQYVSGNAYYLDLYF